MSEPGPAKKLTLLDATLLVMGGIIGVGIFFNPHTIAARVPEPVPYLLLWVFGGLVAIAAGFTFAELGGTFPRAGGWFVYLRAAFGRPLAFVFAWVVLCVQSTGAIASIAKFCASRVRILVPEWFGERAAVDGETLVAALLVGSVTLVALTGVKRAALVQNVCMVTKLLVIAALIVGGLLVVGAGDAPDGPVAAAAPARTLTSGGLVLALLPLFYTLGGWQLVGYIAPEVKDPVRNVPRAILLGVAGVVLVYLAINASYLAVLGIDGLASDPGFAQALSVRAFGPLGEKVLAAGMCISAFGICVVNIITTPWLYVAMAREGLFFESVGALDARTGVPRRALLLQAGFTCVYLLFTLDFLVDSVVFVEWIFHLLAAAGLLLLRVRQPDLPRPYRSPLYPLAPLVYLAAALVVVGGNLLAPEARYLRDAAGERIEPLGVPIELRVLGLSIVLAGALAYRPWRALVERTRGPGG
jgi:APA family basic amino acid/polyamine antiporter